MKKIGITIMVLFSLIILNGCATTPNGLKIQALRNQIQALEAQIQAKDQEINNLRDELIKQSQKEREPALPKVASKKKYVAEIKSRPTARHIQIALKNAGYNPGSVDGRMGRQTRQAIREFQRANNLLVDGRVGKETWNLLKEYLYQKVK
jgi:TolA-binding protein